MSDVNYTGKGSLQATGSTLYDRNLDVYGVELIVGGAVGGQGQVPDGWAHKVAQSIVMIMDPTGSGINVEAQETMKDVLAGEQGTWHAGSHTYQRILKGSGDEYPLNPLADYTHGDLDAFYGAGTEVLLNGDANDMVWYQNSSHDGVTTAGDNDITELFEHIMHTLHVHGVRGAVEGSVEALNYYKTNQEPYEANDNSWKTSELYLAVKEAVENDIFYPEYAPDLLNHPKAFEVAAKEYTYSLNFSMWEMGKEFWTDKNVAGDGSLEPEWSDSALTPEGVLLVNPLGYSLFNKYFAPVLSKPDFSTLRSMFQDDDGGLSGYVSDEAAALAQPIESPPSHTATVSVVTRDGSTISDVDVVLSDGTNSSSYKSAANGSVSGELASGSASTVTGSLAYSSSTKAISSQDALDALKLSVGLSTSAGTKTAFDFISADFNQDGKVSSQDALAILKNSVGLPTTEQAKWVFVDTSGNYSGVSKSNTSYTEGVSIADLSADTTVGLTGILIGDVNDSYSGLIA